MQEIQPALGSAKPEAYLEERRLPENDWIAALSFADVQLPDESKGMNLPILPPT